MYVEDVLREYRRGNLRIGDTVTFTGLEFVSCLPPPYQPPYYYCKEEQYDYRRDLRKIDRDNIYEQDDVMGFCCYYASFLCPLTMEYKPFLNSVRNNKGDIVHFITYDLDYAFAAFTSYSTSSEPTGDLFTVTGKLMQPMNVSETPFEIGVGCFEYIRYDDAEFPEEHAVLNQSFYDGRPLIDLTRFSEEFQQIKVQQVLNRTGMTYEDFHWVFQKEPNILDWAMRWNLSDAWKEMLLEPWNDE